MKRYRFLFLLLAALSMTSCLDEHPKDQLDEDAIYGSASDIYINAVASLYNYIGGANESEGIQGTCRGIYDYNTLTTDEAMIPIRGGDWYDGGLWNAMYLELSEDNILPQAFDPCVAETVSRAIKELI